LLKLGLTGGGELEDTPAVVLARSAAWREFARNAENEENERL